MSSSPVPVDGSDELRAPVKQELISAEDDARRIPEPDVVELKPAVDDLRTKERDLQQSLRNLRQQNRAQEVELVDLRKEVEQLRKKPVDQQPHADPALPSEPLESSTSNGAPNTPNRKTHAARKPGTVVKSFGAAQLAQAQAEKQQAIERLTEAEQQLRQLQLESNAEKRRIPTLEAKISEMTAISDQAATEKEALRRELRRLQQRYNDLEQKAATTTAELSQLRQEHGRTQQELLRQCERASRHEDKEKDLQNEMERLKSELGRAPTIEELVELRQELEGTQRELGGERQRATRLDEEKEKLKNEVQRLQSDLFRAPTPAELVQLRQEHQRTQQELEGERQRANLLAGENKRLQNEVERLQSDLLRAPTPAELVDLRQEHQQTLQELERQRQRATRLDGENIELQNKVQRLESEKRAARASGAKRKRQLNPTKDLTIAPKKRRTRFARGDDDAGAQGVNGDPMAFVKDTEDGWYKCSYPDVNNVQCGHVSERRENLLIHVRGMHFGIRVVCTRCQQSCGETAYYKHMWLHQAADAEAERKRRAMEHPERLTRRQAREAEERASAEPAQEDEDTAEEGHDV